MAQTLNIKASITGSQTSALDLGTAEFPVSLVTAVTLTAGTGANQADVLFSDTRTLSASATEDLDLAGALTGAFGATATFAKLKGLFIYAASGNTNNVNVTRPASNGAPVFLAAGDGMPIPPGGWIQLCGPGSAGWCSITAGTGDLLTITNSAGSTSVTYSVIIVGTSA